MASRRRYCRPLCGEREQISLEPYTEQQKQSPSLHVSPPPSVPFPDSDHQIAGTDIDNGFSTKIRLRERYAYFLPMSTVLPELLPVYCSVKVCQNRRQRETGRIPITGE
ncbi:hypothetical protein CMV_018063 [Castanea mollissima]|uniref:Uncharacterized protein n=1 Tax=Castanea mollissima TaxID=60419 RepID=A0A8J4R368_9ROSI|nr:hypothetical protein CMV_018063 [Castanea mollissima]